MHIEDSPLSEAQRKNFIEITDRWWKEAEDGHIRHIIPYAEKRNGRWFAIAKLFDDSRQEWVEPLDRPVDLEDRD